MKIVDMFLAPASPTARLRLGLSLLESGRFKDGTELEPKHVELRHRIMVEDQFWVDSGKILSEDWT